MNKNNKGLYILAIIAVLFLGFLIGYFTKGAPSNNEINNNVEPTIEVNEEELLDEHGTYDTKDEVALYIHTYNHLPENYMTKSEAREHGWSGGALNRVVKGKCIGGDVYNNFEGNLPDIDGTYYECDIDTLTKKKRGAKRIVFSDEGDIYYTADHYETFELLYGADE